MIIDVGVGFKKNWRKDYNRDERSLQLQVSQSDADKIKQRVADEFKTVFTNELTKAGYEVSNYNLDLAAHDILVLRPAIMDLVVTAPDTGAAGSGRAFTASAGAMTLYLEFHDSVTSALLGRVVDRKADNSSTWSMSSRVTNKADADRIFRQWAGQLIAKMDAVMAKPE